MTDIEARALALVNEVAVKFRVPPWDSIDRRSFLEDVLCHAIEAHDAFRQEVSERMLNLMSAYGVSREDVADFIIQPKTDPLAEGDELKTAAQAISALPELIEALNGLVALIRPHADTAEELIALEAAETALAKAGA